MTRGVRLAGAVALAALLVSGCCFTDSNQPNPEPSARAPLVDVAGEMGLRFERKLPDRVLSIREIAGGGAALLDYNRDGWLDILLVAQDFCRLYRSEAGATFTDVTDEAGLPRRGAWIGCASADYNGDGYPDLWISGYGVQALLRNEGGIRFTDVTRAAGLEHPAGDPYFNVGGAWGDIDGDGWPDLYVPRYLRYLPGMPAACPGMQGVKGTCPPDKYAPQFGALYRNEGGRRFTNITRSSGASNVHGKAWSALFFDQDDDGRQDLYLANDETPGDLLRNLGGGRFENVGIPSGVAFDADGRVHGAMGADAGDYNRDGRLDLVVTTFISEPYSLYRNEDGRVFSDLSNSVGLATPTHAPSGWGTRFFDWDNDGWLDLLFVNGHATSSTRHDAGPHAGMPMSMQLFRNLQGRFAQVHLGELERPIIGRGAAFGDWDNDGFTDVVVMTLAGPVLLLRNQAGAAGGAHWIGLQLRGKGPNRDALGARVTLHAGGQQQIAEVQTCGSIHSSHDPRLRFGLAGTAVVDEVDVRWPDGEKQRFERLPVDQYLELRQGQAEAVPLHLKPAVARTGQ